MTEIENIINRISEILIQRHKDWPYRKKASKDFEKETEKFYKHIKESEEFKAYIPDKETIKSVKKAIENPLILCGNMKSGTSLLGQLLDFHKQLFVFPGDSHFYTIFSKKNSFDKDTFCNWWLRKAINPTGQKPTFPYGTEKSDYIKFIKTLHYFYEKNNQTSATLFAFISVFGKKISNFKYWAEKTPGNEFVTNVIIKKYPNAKFIHIIRNPFENIVSLKKNEVVRNRKSSTWLKSVFFRLSYEKAFSNKQRIKDYLTVYYENLLSSPLSETKKICSFLNIEFDDILLIPTVNGIPASANSMNPEHRTTGKILQKDNLKKNLLQLSRHEKYMIYAINKSIIKEIAKQTKTAEQIMTFNNLFYKLFYSGTYYIYKIYRKIHYS